MESPWQSALAIALAAGCAGLVGWRVIRPFLPKRRPRSERTELVQIDPAPATAAASSPDNADRSNAADKSKKC